MLVKYFLNNIFLNIINIQVKAVKSYTHNIKDNNARCYVKTIIDINIILKNSLFSDFKKMFLPKYARITEKTKWR